MRTMWLTLSAAVLLSGCGPSAAPAPPVPQPTIKVSGEEQKRLAAATELDRAIAFKRAIYASKSTCRRVVATGFVRTYESLEMWQANCDDARNWAIFVAPNGQLQVRPCTDLKELKLPECKELATGKGAVPEKKKPA